MLKLLHACGEFLLGILLVAALAACLLAWRLSQGPIDVTSLVRSAQPRLATPGLHVAVGQAALSWAGWQAAGAPLVMLAHDVVVGSADRSMSVDLRQAKVAVSISQLLLARVVPRSISVDGAAMVVRLGPGGQLPGAGTPQPRDTGAALGPRAVPPWLAGLRSVAVRNATMTLQGALPGSVVLARDLNLDVTRQADGAVAGSARVALQTGAVQATVDAHAATQDGGTRVTLATGAVSPAALAGLAPGLAALAMLDAPVRLTAAAELGPSLQFVSARVEAAAGAGVLRAGQGSVALASLAATLTVRPDEAKLDSLRVALAPASGPGTTGMKPPVLTANAIAARLGGRLRASFTAAIDGVALADLPYYWPEGTGGGARSWLVQNIPAGQAHDAQVAGTLEGAADGSNLALTALAGGLDADDVTLFWLRPIPGLEHGRAHLVLQGPDALLVTMDRGGQNNLELAPGSSIRITGLSQAHQFGDIDVGLSGPLPDALGLLNHPRLGLLARSGIDIVGATGAASARLTMRVPLEDQVTMDDIILGVGARLTDVHLGRIAAGRDLDHADMSLKITSDGMNASGTGEVAGIPARLGLMLDFRGGKPGQVQQHVTANGTATPAQLSAAGLPPGAVHVLSGGQAGLSVDYQGLRDGMATLRVDADLGQAGVALPLGWSKPVGQAASVGGRVLLNHGRLSGVDDLHANGPGLVIVSRAELSPQGRTLHLDRLEFGRTQAHGQVGFPADLHAPLQVNLSGPMLDLSPLLDPPPKAAAAKPASPAPAQPETPGQPWAARLSFDQVQLSRGRTLAPFSLDGADDGLRILHGQVRAGTAGELVASITPKPGGRDVSIQAADAGVVLRALGVADNLAGGRLQMTGAYEDTKPGSPLSGTATLSEFNMRDAPAIGRLLQGMTLYGLVDLLHGPGLHVSKLIAPFRWQDDDLGLTNARAFSPSLGLTAKGDIDLRRRVANISGTVVPAYFFNQLLGDLPVIGRVFSPEKGGGVFAARYWVRGPLSDPHVGVNPLSALTPGFLREGFGVFAPKTAK